LNELAEFMKTDKFQHSFMSKAESFKVNFSNGGWRSLK